MGALFLLQIAGGCMAMMAACRRDHVAPSYLRLMTWVSLALLFASLTTTAQSGAATRWDGPSLWMMAAAVLIWVAVPKREGAQSPGLPPRTQRMLLTLAAALVMIGMALLARDRFGDSPAEWLAVPLGAMVVGGATAGMLLGHAYLTQTQMPIDPLMRLVRILIVVILLKSLWSIGLLIARWQFIQHPGRDPMWLWLMVSVRVGVGLLGLGLLTYMVWDCTRRRSTQSATGILYIAMIFACFGELSALELGRTFDLWV